MHQSDRIAAQAQHAVAAVTHGAWVRRALDQSGWQPHPFRLALPDWVIETLPMLASTKAGMLVSGRNRPRFHADRVLVPLTPDASETCRLAAPRHSFPRCPAGRLFGGIRQPSDVSARVDDVLRALMTGPAALASGMTQPDDAMADLAFAGCRTLCLVRLPTETGALDGAVVAPGEATPVAVPHILRSPDSCMVCTVH